MKVHSRGHSTSIGGQPPCPACPQHVRGDALPKDRVIANHLLRRAYATAATTEASAFLTSDCDSPNGRAIMDTLTPALNPARTALT
jgi:hypothetical protein